MGIRSRFGRAAKDGAARDDSAGHERRASEQEALDVARCKYVLRVASAPLLEQIHREAFAALPVERLGPVYRRMCHDLPEGDRPTSVAPAELARAAVAAQQKDHGYMLRALRRPGQGVSEGHALPGTGSRSNVPLFAGSVLGPFAAAVAAAPSTSEVLAGFEYSPEAAQVDPSLFARGPNVSRDRWGQVATGGYDMGGGFDAGSP